MHGAEGWNGVQTGFAIYAVTVKQGQVDDDAKAVVCRVTAKVGEARWAMTEKANMRS